MGGDSGAKLSPCAPAVAKGDTHSFLRSENNTGGDTPCAIIGMSPPQVRERFRRFFRAVRLTFLAARTTTRLGVDFLFSARIVD